MSEGPRMKWIENKSPQSPVEAPFEGTSNVRPAGATKKAFQYSFSGCFGRHRPFLSEVGEGQPSWQPRNTCNIIQDRGVLSEMRCGHTFPTVGPPPGRRNGCSPDHSWSRRRCRWTTAIRLPRWSRRLPPSESIRDACSASVPDVLCLTAPQWIRYDYASIGCTCSARRVSPVRPS